MSRFKKFAHSLVSGYVLLGANVVFSLASVPLALKYLSTSEFGLWALVSQITTYLALIDLGMSSSVGRALFDFKDDRTDGAYGSVIQTGFLVLLLQGVTLFVIGVVVTPTLASLLNIPSELRAEFFRLMWWQCAVTATGFSTKIFQHLLIAQHRYEINNYAQTAVFVLNLLLIWIFFRLGWKLISLPIANAICWLLSSILSWIACQKLHVFPERGCWGRPSWARLADMLIFGRDVFLVTLGAQLILASQTVVVTRAMGLEASAIWSVCTKSYNLICQLVWRVFDFSGSAFVEMIVRGEKARLLNRFRQVITITASASALAGVGFAIANEPFVSLWTSGRVGWNNFNNVLLAGWLVLVSIVRCQGGLVLLTKQVGFLRFIYFIEGLMFFVVANLVAPSGGFKAILITSILCTMCLTGVYGMWRVIRYFDLSFGKLLIGWFLPMYRLVLLLVPMALAVWFLSDHLPDVWRLSLDFVLVGIPGILIFTRFGVPEQIKVEMMNRASSRFRVPLSYLFGSPNADRRKATLEINP